MRGKVSAPRGWVWSKVKYVADFYTGWTPSTGNQNFFHGSNLWANISDLGPKTLYDTAKQISDEAVKQAGINISPAGSVLFSFKLSIGQVSFAGRDMYTNEAIATFPPQSGFNAKWAYWALPVYVPLNADENIYGAKLLNQELIRSAHILVPPPPEQTRIANFLDEQTARIDALIAEKERLLATLTEFRRSRIYQIVTGGESTERIPTKNPYFPRLPPGWSLGRVKHVAESLDAKRIPLNSEERATRSGPYQYYGASGPIDMVDEYIFDEPLVLVGEDGANLVNRATPLAFIATGRYWVNNHAHILRPRDGLLNYWAYTLDSLDVSDWVTGSAQPKLTIEALMNLPVPLGPLEVRAELQREAVKIWDNILISSQLRDHVLQWSYEG